MAAQPTVQSVKETTGLSATGQTTRQYNVQFMVGTQGPYSLTIPESDFTAENVQAKMQEFAAKINALVPGE